jgi:hypothetical protein
MILFNNNSHRSRKGDSFRARKTMPFLFSLFLIILSWGSYAKAQTSFVVDDIVVSSRRESLSDPEYVNDVNEGPALTFQDDQDTGNLWVCAIDAGNGTWTPRNGKQTLVDQGLAPTAVTRQGPEWAIDSGGSRIVYTKNEGGVGAIGVAKRGENGWQTSILPDSERSAAYDGSKEESDSSARVLFKFAPGSGPVKVGWRTLDESSTAQWVPVDNPMEGGWARGLRAVVILDGNTGQVLRYDIDTLQIQQLTTGGGDKRFPVLWQNLNFSNPQLALVLNGETLAIYQEDGSVWKKTDQAEPPSKYRYIFRPEYFEFGGRSFVHFTVGNRTNPQQTTRAEVWIAEISDIGTILWFRRVNDPKTTRIKDSEVLVTDRTAYIYYTEILSNGNRLIHRCASGL